MPKPRIADVQAAKAKDASPALRTALLTECAERTFPVYELLRDRPSAEAFKQAIGYGWEFAAGKKIPMADIEACSLGIGIESKYYYGKKNDTLGNYSLSFHWILESIERRSKGAYEAFGDGMATYLAVVELVEETLNASLPPAERSETARPHELIWQDSALALIAGWKGAPHRGMFDSLGNKPPAWIGERFPIHQRKPA